MEQTFEVPNQEETELLSRQIQAVNDLLLSLGESPLDDSPADAGRLQTILDASVLQKEDTWQLQCLGIALGNIMVKELPLHWTMMSDDYGRDAALRYKETSTVFFPLTMISKRVERDESVDINWLLEQGGEHFERLHPGVDRSS